MTDHGKIRTGDPPHGPDSSADDEPRGPGDHLDEDACTDIVAGLVSPAYFERAMEHVRNCAACELKLMAAGSDLESSRARQAPAGWGSPAPPRVNEIHEIQAQTSRPPRGLRAWAIPLAAAATLLVLVLTAIPRLHGPAEDRTYWMNATGDLLRLRGSHSWDADSAFWAGLDAYGAHDAERASKMLQSSRASGGLEDLRRLYLASSLVNSGHGKDALELLDALAIEDLPMPWREEAWWMKFQALTILHRSKEAKTLLDRMADWQGRVGDLARKARSRESR